MFFRVDAARFWDKTARRYARHAIGDIAGYERTLDRARSLLARDAVVCEIGCGTGTTALRLAPFVARIDASDVSGEMIAIAREKAAAGLCGNVEFSVASAETDHGESGSYDAVLAFNLLHLVADLPATLAACHRLLKPGGMLISKTPCLSEMSPLVRLAVPAMQLIGQAPPVSFFAAPALQADIARAGFTITESERHGSGRKDPRIFLVARKPGIACL